MRPALFGLVLPLAAALQGPPDDAKLSLSASVLDDPDNPDVSVLSLSLTHRGSNDTAVVVVESPDVHLWNMSVASSVKCRGTGPSSPKIRCERRQVMPESTFTQWVSVRPDDPWATNFELPLNFSSYTTDPATGQLRQFGQGSQTIKWTLRRYRQPDASKFPQPRTMTVSALPKAEDERARLNQLFRWADFVSTGFYLNPGMPLTVSVAGVGDAASKPEMLVGTPDLVDPTDPAKDLPANLEPSGPLSNGENTVYNPHGGILYIRYSCPAGQAESHPPINVTIEPAGDAAQPFPLFRQGVTTDAEWMAMLKTTTVPFAEVDGARVILTGLVQHALAAARLGQRQQSLLDTYSDIIAAQDAISGLDANASDPRDRPSPLRPLVVWSSSSSTVAADAIHYRAALRTMPFDMWLSLLLSRSWMIWHELGHQRQHDYTWSWQATSEVTVNIYSLAASRAISGGTDGELEHGTVQEWDEAKANLTRGIEDYEANDHLTQLVMFEQLRLVFGDDFYVQLHRRSRSDPEQAQDSDKKHYFMTRAADIARTDLGHFFTKWGLQPEQRTKDEMAKQPKPLEDYTARPVFGGL